jgi:hypothetical protein
VARSPAAWWRLAGDKFLGSSTMAERRMRRARGAEVGLTDVVAQPGGGGAAASPASSGSCGGGREG